MMREEKVVLCQKSIHQPVLSHYRPPQPPSVQLEVLLPPHRELFVLKALQLL
jgi:hypothetical protein